MRRAARSADSHARIRGREGASARHGYDTLDANDVFHGDVESGRVVEPMPTLRARVIDGM